MAVIVDTSCLIILSKINKLDLLKQLFTEVIIPEAVSQEFGEPLPAYLQVYTAPIDDKLLQMASAFLDKGESEVIALALETNAEGVIIDEKKGRKMSKAMGLKVIGTMGVLARATIDGLIEDIEVVVRDVKSKGFFISEKQLNEIRDYVQRNKR